MDSKVLQLGVVNRILLLNILPKEGTVLTLRMLRKLKEALAFTEDEIKDWNIRTEGDNVRWDPAKEVVKEFIISPVLTDLVVKTFEEADRQGKVSEQMLDLYDMFFTN